MRFGRICVRNDAIENDFKGRGPIPGFWNGAMELRVEFIFARLEMTGSPANRFLRGYTGA